jgi:DNA-directed RNA polymerase alpha subunit
LYALFISGIIGTKFLEGNMDKIKFIEEVERDIERQGLIPTIKKVFGAGAKIRLPFSERACSTPIEQLNLSVRSYNCLKRAGLCTVERVVEAIIADELWKIRNLGKNSRAEIHVKIYEFGYGELSNREKREFVKSLCETNGKI